MRQCLTCLYQLCGSIIVVFLSFTVSAQTFDQAYLNWKTKQEAQDRKLQTQQYHDYYLAKPALQTQAQQLHSSVATAAKVNINQANVTELQQLHGIGQKKAEAIVAYRQQHGPFQHIDDLQKVKGIGPALLNKNRARLAL
jgi:competence protein ComEA